MSIRPRAKFRFTWRGAARIARRPANVAVTAAVIAAAVWAVHLLGPAHGRAPRGASAAGYARHTTASPRAAKESGGMTVTPLDPALFATGSCMEFSPAGARETVFIDAGHGGIDPGGVGVTENGAQVTESQVNLSIEMDAMRVLTGEGYRVVVSRTTQTTVLKLGPGDTDGNLLTVAGAKADVAARDECANMAHADLLVGLYMNSGYYGEAGSVTAYDSARPFAQDNVRFAGLLQDDVLGKLDHAGYGIPDGGVLSDTQLGSTLSLAAAEYGHLLLLGPAKAGYFSTPSQMPGALIEPLFVTDPFEASVAVSSRGQHLIAAGIAAAVGQYFATASQTASDVQSAGEITGEYHVFWDHVAHG